MDRPTETPDNADIIRLLGPETTRVADNATLAPGEPWTPGRRIIYDPNLRTMRYADETPETSIPRFAEAPSGYSSLHIARELCSTTGHEITLYKMRDGDELICRKCGLTNEEIRAGEMMDINRS